MAIKGNCQLSDFNLQVTPTNESCANNGSIQIQTSNTTAGATISYSLYKLPNTVTPIAQFTNNTLNSLDSGDYRLLATQELGDASNSQSSDFTIVDETIPLQFTVVQSTQSGCDQTGTLTVNVTSGLGPFFYEIIEGPVLAPLQVSNIFSGLPGGFYKIRVIDNCGSGEVLDYTLLLGTTNLTIGDTYSPPVATSCTDRDVMNLVTPSAGTDIIYPLDVHYIFHLPGGVDQTFDQNFPSGPTDELELMHNVPLFLTDSYTYDVFVTDSCGHIFQHPGNLVDPSPKLSLAGFPDECGNMYLSVTVENFFPPYTLNFTVKPAGFNPAAYNVSHPGPYFVTSVDYGTSELTVPFGSYTVEMLDGCGRSVSTTALLEEKILTPIVTVSSPSCLGSGGMIRIALPEARKIVSAFITVAPAAYTIPLPSNVTSFINPDSGILTVTSLPIGEYTLTFRDECGKDYTQDAEIKVFIPDFNLVLSVLPGCTPDIASARLRSPNGVALTSVIVETAPAEYVHPLPYNATADISNGMLFMTDLPAGNYSFSGTDACGFALSVSRSITGYNPGTNNFNFVPHCGSFDLTVTDHSSIMGVSYWLQKLDTVTNTWGHPGTGEDYTEGTTPTSANSVALPSGSPVYNLVYTGTFRIVKVYQTYDAGSAYCYDRYPSFTFLGSLEVLNVYSLECEGGSGPSSVYIDVSGVPPYKLRILTKDGNAFPVDNGSSTTFQNLAVGNYTIQIEDSCFRTRIVSVNVGTLLPLVQATDPASQGKGELLVCSETGETTGIFDLTSLNSIILGNQSPDNYTITYHTSQGDADNGQQPIMAPQAYVNTSNGQPIFVRIVHKTIGICFDTTSFKLYVGQVPVLSLALDQYICEEGKIRIFADSGYDSYKWSTGEITSYIDVDEPGVYSVTVSNVYGDSKCGATKSINVIGSGPPAFTSIKVNDWTDDQNSITVNVTGSGDYVYSLDGENYQVSNVFTNLISGIYMVYVKDTHGCGIISERALVFNYPRFFTPNGDGFNDTWQIKLSFLEPDMKIYIYDRYGKLLTGFKSGGPGWDGTYNGHPLPSTDYWFVVERVDGTVHRGHFAMKR